MNEFSHCIFLRDFKLFSYTLCESRNGCKYYFIITHFFDIKSLQEYGLNGTIIVNFVVNSWF